jgi:hypothetical protein
MRQTKKRQQLLEKPHEGSHNIGEGTGNQWKEDIIVDKNFK